MKIDTVFLVDSDANFALPLETSLKATGFAVHFFSSSSHLLKWLPKHARAHNAVIVANVNDVERETLLLELTKNFSFLPLVLSIAKPCISTAVDLMRVGASYVLHKPYSAEQLQRTLTAIEPACQTTGRESDTAETDSQADPQIDSSVYRRLKSLSPRQKEILVNVFEGRINKVIAYRLGISIKTVELHRARMMQKMQATSAVDLIKMTLPHSDELVKQVTA